MSRLTIRDRRALVLGCAVITVAFIGTRGIPGAVRAISGLRARAEAQNAMLARAQTVLASEPVLRDSLTGALRRVVALAPRLMPGSTFADAQAGLSALVTGRAERHALKVIEVDPLPDSVAGPFHRVALHAVLEGDIRGVTAFLAAVEAGNPLLTAVAVSVSTADPAPHDGHAEALRFEVEVAGYYLAGGAS